jgi:hypothetical protein
MPGRSEMKPLVSLAKSFQGAEPLAVGNVLTNDKLEAARTGNWFAENSLVICRLDKLSRNDDVQAKLEPSDWDLIVCDEAHNLSGGDGG